MISKWQFAPLPSKAVQVAGIIFALRTDIWGSKRRHLIQALSGLIEVDGGVDEGMETEQRRAPHINCWPGVCERNPTLEPSKSYSAAFMTEGGEWPNIMSQHPKEAIDGNRKQRSRKRRPAGGSQPERNR